jgi:hypothetical protein
VDDVAQAGFCICCLFGHPDAIDSAGRWCLAENCSCLQVGIVLIWQWHSSCILHLLLVLLQNSLVNLNLWWCKSWCSNELKPGLPTNFLASQRNGFSKL